MLLNSSTQWGVLTRVFHWLTLVMVVMAWGLVEAHEWYPRGSDARDNLMDAHFLVGTLTFLVIALRVVLKLMMPRPASTASGLQGSAARLVQWGLLLLLLALPLTGASYLVLDGHANALILPAGWFDTVPVNEALAEELEEVHKDVLFPLFAFLMLGHAGAALHHHFVKGDDVLRGIWRGK